MTSPSPFPAGEADPAAEIRAMIEHMTAPKQGSAHSGAASDSTDYDGFQPAGGRSLRVLPGLHILKVSVGPMDNNAFLLTDPRTGAQLLIDAAADPERLFAEIDPDQLQGIVTTHQHPDHWQALVEVRQATEAATYAHALDAPAVAPDEAGSAITQTLGHGDEITVGEARLSVIHLRGHTPGGLALSYRDPSGATHIFTGDSLFPGGIGATATPQDFEQLFADVSEKIFQVHADDTWVYPGHGNDTTLGAERSQLPDWASRRW